MLGRGELGRKLSRLLCGGFVVVVGGGGRWKLFTWKGERGSGLSWVWLSRILPMLFLMLLLLTAFLSFIIVNYFATASCIHDTNLYIIT